MVVLGKNKTRRKGRRSMLARFKKQRTNDSAEPQANEPPVNSRQVRPSTHDNVPCWFECLMFSVSGISVKQITLADDSVNCGKNQTVLVFLRFIFHRRLQSKLYGQFQFRITSEVMYPCKHSVVFLGRHISWRKARTHRINSWHESMPRAGFERSRPAPYTALPLWSSFSVLTP